MKPLSSFAETVWWLVRTAVTIVIALLLVRALIEYVPALEVFPPARALLRWWDPLMTDLLQPFGLAWSHDIRSLGLPAVAVALILLRTMFDDIFSSLFRPRTLRKSKLPVAVQDALAADAPPPVFDSRGQVTDTQPPGPPPVTTLGPGPAVMRTGSQQRPSLPMDPNADPNATMIKPAVTTTSVSSSGTRFSPLQKAAAPASRIGRFDLVEELGRGAMGVVYKGLDPMIGRTVAIKTISAVGTGADVDEYRARFLVEARSAGRLNHPGIVSVYDVTDDESGRPSLVLEYVAGTPFDKLLSGKTLNLMQALDVVAQVARALDYAHSNGVIHRDVKPANIMVTADHHAKLSDFGIAKIDGTTMTVVGQVLGTPAFMSPEQCTGGHVDARSDIFSLGAVLYAACTGERPFAGTTFTAVAYKVVHEQAVPPTQVNPELPADLDRIVARCLAKEPADRYASAGQVAADLDHLKSQPGPS